MFVFNGAGKEDGPLRGPIRGPAPSRGSNPRAPTLTPQINETKHRNDNRNCSTLSFYNLSSVLSRDRICDRILRSYLKKGAAIWPTTFIDVSPRPISDVTLGGGGSKRGRRRTSCMTPLTGSGLRPLIVWDAFHLCGEIFFRMCSLVHCPPPSHSFLSLPKIKRQCYKQESPDLTEWARQTGAICQIGVLTRKRCIV